MESVQNNENNPLETNGTEIASSCHCALSEQQPLPCSTSILAPVNVLSEQQPLPCSTSILAPVNVLSEQQPLPCSTSILAPVNVLSEQHPLLPCQCLTSILAPVGEAEAPPPSRCALSAAQRAREFTPCYASILLARNEQELRAMVDELEQHIYHTFTARCQQCRKPCLITRELYSFPCISAHHVHQAVQVRRLREYDLC